MSGFAEELCGSKYLFQLFECLRYNSFLQWQRQSLDRHCLNHPKPQILLGIRNAFEVDFLLQHNRTNLVLE